MYVLKTIGNLAFSLSRQDLRERFAGSLFGSLWIFIWPMVQLFIYIVIFGKIMGGRFSGDAQIYSYGVYVASGLIVWTCFANTVLRISRIFLEKKHIISKIHVNLWVFPLAVCLTELLPCILSFSILALVDMCSGWDPTWGIGLYALFALYCLLLLAIGVGMIFAACAVFVRDALEILAVIVQVGFWFTPIVYLPAILPDWVQRILFANPMMHIAAAFQNVFVFGYTPTLSSFFYITLISHCIFLIAIYFVKKLEKDIRDLL